MKTVYSYGPDVIAGPLFRFKNESWRPSKCMRAIDKKKQLNIYLFMKLNIGVLILLLLGCFPGFSQRTDSAMVKSSVSNPPSLFPMLIEKEALASGNPLARYLECVKREKEYKAFPPLSGIYDELRLNFEQFLG